MVVVVRKNQNHLATLPNEMESMNERYVTHLSISLNTAGIQI